MSSEPSSTTPESEIPPKMLITSETELSSTSDFPDILSSMTDIPDVISELPPKVVKRKASDDEEIPPLEELPMKKPAKIEEVPDEGPFIIEAEIEDDEADSEATEIDEEYLHEVRGTIEIDLTNEAYEPPEITLLDVVLKQNKSTDIEQMEEITVLVYGFTNEAEEECPEEILPGTSSEVVPWRHCTGPSPTPILEKVEEDDEDPQIIYEGLPPLEEISCEDSKSRTNRGRKFKDGEKVDAEKDATTTEDSFKKPLPPVEEPLPPVDEPLPPVDEPLPPISETIENN